MAINSLSSASRGMAGLVSGINTEEVVQKLLSGTQSKIDKATQKKSTLLYKQSMYREVASKLKTLQNSFMSFTSKTNLLSSGFFNNMSATLKTPSNTSAAFSVTATTSAAAGTYKMSAITQLASAYSLKSKEGITGGVSGGISSVAAETLYNSYKGEDSNLVIEVGDQAVTIEGAPEQFAGKTSSEVASIINKAFQDNNIAAEARFVNNKLTIYADDSSKFITVHGNTSDTATNKTLAMKMFGEVSSLSAKGTFTSTIDSDLYMPSLTVNLDGRTQEIRLDLDGLRQLAGKDADGNDIASDGGAALVSKLNDSLRQTYGTGVTAELDGNGNIAFKTGSDSSKLTISSNAATMGVFGMKSGISNKLNSAMALKDLNFGIDIQGSQQSFTINGVDFSYSTSTALSTIINDVNASKAGVKISYLEAEDRFVIQRSETGETLSGSTPIDMKQAEGNLLTALFGVAGGADYVGNTVTQTMHASNTVSSEQYYNGGNYTFNVNGRDYTFNIPSKEKGSYYSAKSFTEAMNAAFAKGFGKMTDGTQALEFKLGDDGKFSITANDKSLIVKTSAYDKDKNKYDLGFGSDATTLVNNGSILMEDVGIDLGSGKIVIKADGQTDIELFASDLAGKSFDEMAALLQDKLRAQGANDATVSFDKNVAAFRIMGVDIPMEIAIEGDTDSKNLDNLFGSNKLELGMEAIAGFTTEKHGTNAVAYIDGTKLERSSNTFDYMGMSFTLNSLYNADAADPKTAAATEIVVSRDTQSIIDGIKDYLKVYNETIDYLNELYKADPTYKDYPPLTDEQKTAMSESEIAAWEEKAKEGLLRNDSNIGRILQSMRSAMYTRPEGSSIAIYDLGIDTSYYSKDGNFDLSSEDDLKALLEQDPDAVMKLFAGTGGIMEKVNSAITEATRSSAANPGYLTREAGANSLDTTSNIYKQLKALDEQMVTLENRYWKEYDRYWKQFNSMEQMIQQMNQQSSWLSNLSTSG